jgi:uncharacterized membrane protein YphA (DoxX/SURF4 family)
VSVTLFALTLRFVIGAVFAAAGAVKLARLPEFEAAIDRYELVPDRFVPSAAKLVGLAEVVSGAALLVGFLTPAAGIVIASLLMAFAAAIGASLVHGRRFDCGCGTAAVGREISRALLAQDVALAAASIFVAVKAPRQLAVDGFFGSGSYSVFRALAAPVSAVLLVVGAGLLREARSLSKALV